MVVPVWINRNKQQFEFEFEATGSSETVTTYQTAAHHIPENYNLEIYCCENLRSFLPCYCSEWAQV
jgi:hypothetical protein